MNNQFIQGVTFDWDRIDNNSYLKRIEAFLGVEKLDFNKPVTFFVGENGSGKSTLLEAIAVAHGFNPEGGTKNYVFSTHDTHSELCDAIRISKGYRKEKWGYFLRAESFYNVATQEEEYADFKHPSAKYHEKSHGESFLALAQNNLRPNGLYLFDEPEAALSPQRQLTLLMQIYRCATDGSEEVLSDYQDHAKVSHILLNEHNTGNPFKQWFKGMQLAKGKYIWIAEADDLCELTFLEKVVPLMEKYQQAAVCFAGSKYIDKDGNVLSYDMNKWKSAIPPYAVFNGKTYAEHNLYWRSYIANASSAIFRKSMVNAQNMEQCLQMRYSGDWLFWFYMAMQGDIIERYEVLNYFRQHNQKVTVKAENNGGGKSEDIEIVRIMEQHLTHLSRYKRCIRRGMLYNRIAKLSTTDRVKLQLWELLRQKLNGTRKDGRLERLNRIARLFCPFVLTMKRDRLTPSREIG